MVERHNFSPKARREFLRDSETGKAIKCSIQGCRRNATEIHHKIALCDGGNDDPNNLLMLCYKCHRAIHQKLGDFAKWGRLGGLQTASTKKSFKNLKQFKNKES